MTENLGWKLFLIGALTAAAALLATPPQSRPELVREPLQKYWIHLGLDLSGGAELRLQVPREEARRRGIAHAQAMADTMEVIEKRIQDSGIVKDAVIRRQGEDIVMIQLPGVTKDELAKIKQLITELGSLEFRILAEPREGKPLTEDTVAEDGKISSRPINLEQERAERQRLGAAYVPPKGFAWYAVAERARDQFNADEVLIRLDKYNWTGDKLARVSSDIDPQSLNRVVYFEIRGAGLKAKFGDFTGKHVNDRMAIIFNGQVISAPTIRSKLPGQGVIENMTDEEVSSLTKVLKSGSLSVQPTMVGSNEVGPSLGRYTIRNGQYASLVAFLLVIAFMSVYYLQAGVIASLAVMLNVLLMFALLVLFGATLTLPGIAGIVLTIGMAVDANIIIYERIREEKALGNSLHQAIEAGFDRALTAIIDANVTTFITGLILFYWGSGAVKGFAVTLMIGLATTMFTAVWCTKALIGAALRYAPGLLGPMPMLDAVGPRAIPFMSNARRAMAASLIVVVASLALFNTTSDLYGNDLRGGLLVQAAFQADITGDEVRRALPAEFRAEVQEILPQEAPENTPRTKRKYAIQASNLTLDYFAPRMAQITQELDAYLLAERGEAWLSEQKRQALIGTTTTALGSELGELLRFCTCYAKASELGMVGSIEPGAEKVPLQALAEGASESDPGLRQRLRDVLNKLGAEQISPEYLRFVLEQKFKTQLVPEGIGLPRSVAEGKGFSVPVAFDQKYKRADVESQFRAKSDFSELSVTAPGGAEESYDFVLTVAGEEASDLRQVPVRVSKVQDDTYLLSEPFPTVESIGQLVAKHQKRDALIAMVLSLGATFCYIWLRFDKIYGVAAIVCLAHDVCITLGAVALFGGKHFGPQPLVNVEINLPILSAFLTIVGYSLNDTIIVFDRIRENANRPGRPAFAATADASINQTLGRTFMTAFTTLIAVGALFVLNYQKGGIIEGFAFAMIVGIMVGTYSSVFIATPIVVWWREREERRAVEGKAKAAEAKGKGEKARS